MLHGKRLFNMILALVAAVCAAGGPGYFDSVDGTYDEQTGFAFERTLFMQARTRTFIGPMSRSGNEQMLAGGEQPSFDGTSFIWRKEIDSGDMRRATLEEIAYGMPTYGDKAVVRGDYIAYQNQEYRVNQIDSPAWPVQGEMARQRAAFSISDIPGSVKAKAIDWMAEQIEIEALIALIYGASPACLKTTANGGLGVSLGFAGTAGVPLMARHFWDPENGSVAWNATQATYNAAVNTAVNAITAGAAGYLTLVSQVKIRKLMDDLKFAKGTYGGKTYKAVCLMDPELFWRLHNYLEASKYLYGLPRATDNPIFGIDNVLDYYGVRYVNVPNLAKLRAFYNAGDACISLGNATSASALCRLTNPYQFDHRNYTCDTYANGARALAIYIGAGALLEGVNGAISVTDEVGPHKKGLEYSAHTKEGFVRGEWHAKDGRVTSDAAYCNSVIVAAYSEPGIGVSFV